jgi:sulfur-carrier protein adenylyltransferase/sulfurtransferase
MLSPAELSRYARQLVLPELGVAGQERLRASSVLVVGAGGLGSPAALYLAAAGVGTIGLVDDDSVELSNLHRQILHATPTVGRGKTASGAEAIERLNPHVRVRTHQERLNAQRAAAMFPEYDVIVDGSDNYATRYVVNDACARLHKVWIYGSVERFSGQVSLFGAPSGPCYRCIFAEAPAPGATQNCEEIGVLGAVPGVVGSMQALEALKWIVGAGEPLVGRLLQLDLGRMVISEVRFDRRPDCPACSSPPVARAEPTDDYETDIEPSELVRRLGNGGAPRLIDVRDPWEFDIASIASADLIPMSELQEAIGSLDRGTELVLYCHHGTRSGMAAEFLRARGFRARSLSGGIDRWSREIDPALRRY